MSDEFPRPRVAPELKREFVRRIVACGEEREAAQIAEALWSKLRGDMQDRITSLIYAAKGAVEAEDMNARREGLKRALELLDGKEAAATTIRRPPKEES